MRTTLLLWAAGLAAGLGSALPAAAQVSAAAGDSAAWVAAATSYQAALGTESVLYDGQEYVDYTTPGTVGHQFFLSPEEQPGTVAYRGGTFAGVPLRYDLAHDQVVIRLPGQAAALALVSDKVAAFTLAGHRFVRVAGDSLLPTGFYEVLAEGPLRLLARHRKQSQRATVSQNLVQQYKQYDELLLRTPAAAVAVSSLRKLVALLPTTRQDEVLRYARQQRLAFGATDRAASAAQVLRYYYSLRP